MTIREFVNGAKASLTALYDEAEAGAVVTRLCEEVLGLRSYEWIIDPSMAVPEEHSGALSAAMNRLRAGEPLQYVLGYSDFCGFRFNVNPTVLIPRPETEELCYRVVDRLSRSGGGPWKIMDLCTGSGCIAWTLALSLPGSRIVGADISDGALATARSQPLGRDAARLGALPPVFVKYDVLSGSLNDCHQKGRINHNSSQDPSKTGEGRSFGLGNILNKEESPFLEEEFDVIVSNPPYVRESEKDKMRPNVLDHEPGLALFVPDEDPLVIYKKISDFALKRLRPGGFGFVEINEALEGPTVEVFKKSGLSRIESIKDFRAKFRFISFCK